MLGDKRMITNFIAMNSNPVLTMFKEYVLSFYGVTGIYPIEGLTDADVELAIQEYIKVCANPNRFEEWGDGDSIDRERVRDIILTAKEMV